MKNNKKGFVIPLIIAIVAILVIAGGIFVYRNKKVEAPIVVNPNIYTNAEYDFSMQFPVSWKGFSVVKSSWTGRLIDGTTTYNGVTLIFKNPQSTTSQAWQDIPIMVITPDIWKLMAEEKIAVSAAPIGPGKIGENSNYVFATPPRWWGFTDALGGKEAADIVTTFKVISTPTTPIIGGDKDEHGCLGPAGYSWCEVKNKCLRVWEEKCENTPINSGPGDKDGPVACTMDAMMCPDGTYVGRSAPDCKFICPAVEPNIGAGENDFCGGIAGIRCASGLTCKYDGTYPDAGGKCIK